MKTTEEPSLWKIIETTREHLPSVFEINFVVEKHGSWIELIRGGIQAIETVTIGQDPDAMFADLWFSLVNLARRTKSLEPIDWRKEIES